MIELNPIPKRLEQYLSCEQAINRFNDEVGYCFPNCISNAHSLFISEGVPLRGDIGCCIETWPNDPCGMMEEDFAILYDARKGKYGIPRNKEEEVPGYGQPCDYHTSVGCVLSDYKAPICLSFMCDPQIDYLRDEFRIDYDMDEVWNFLEAIIWGIISDKEVQGFITKFDGFVQQMQETNGI